MLTQRICEYTIKTEINMDRVYMYVFYICAGTRNKHEIVLSLQHVVLSVAGRQINSEATDQTSAVDACIWQGWLQSEKLYVHGQNAQIIRW